jgi:hypothetical protein
MKTEQKPDRKFSMFPSGMSYIFSNSIQARRLKLEPVVGIEPVTY